MEQAGNPTASMIHPWTLDDAFNLGLLTDDERGALISMAGSRLRCKIHRDDDVSLILQELESEVETLGRVLIRCSRPAESHQRKSEPPPACSENPNPNPNVNQAQVQEALEVRLKGTFEREIPGTLGRIYVFKYPPSTIPERIAVKTIDPARIKDSTSISAVGRLAHEVKHWIAYRHSPFIIAPLFTEFIYGWPYIAMPYCERTLREYIDGIVPKNGLPEALALMVQVICGLEYARERGLTAHQDLKPENVLLQDLPKRFASSEDYPFHWRAKLADFGLANGYLELNVRWGSRPYLAPEQYDTNADLSQVDIFACGVMLHELVTGGHPIGEVTSEVWPNPPENSKKWKHEEIWKKWARSDDKLLGKSSAELEPVHDLVVACLSTEPRQRPSLESFKQSILHALKQIDPAAREALLMVLAKGQCDAIYSETLGAADIARYQQDNID
ncbi:MAG: protein kinase, partial [Nitrospira defluvii]|nr:protein kinase [Nitrospira defluvii]